MKKINLNTILNILLVIIVGIYVGRYFYMQPAYHNGDKAPNFIANTINGNKLELFNLQGKYILLDFWGSWCGPCRKESPQLVKLYRNFHDKTFENADGFEIVSIAIERNATQWKRAIENDQLNWPNHVLDKSSNMKFFNSEIAQKYKIKQIPTKYLIDPHGKIIGVNLSAEQVENVLRQATSGD